MERIYFVLPLLDQARDVVEIVVPLWERVAQFGVLAVIVVWLFIERYLVALAIRNERQQERDLRHKMGAEFKSIAHAVDRNTDAVEHNTREFRNLTYAMISGGKVRAQDTPPSIPKV